MAAELLQATGGRVEQMSSSSTSSSFTSSTSSPKLRKVVQAWSSTLEEHSGVQRKTSAVVESFSQVQKSSQIPEGESVPDFEVKLRPVTAQEDEHGTASFCTTSKNLTLEDADVFKCIASNTHGEAIYSKSLIVTEHPALDFKKMLKKRSVEKRREEKRPPTEEEMLNLAGAEKRDYTRGSAEHGFTGFRGILKKLKEVKKKVEVEMVRVLKPLEDITATAGTSIVFDTILELKDPNIRMQWFLAAELLRIQYSHGKYRVKQMGSERLLCISGVGLGDTATYTLQVADKRLSARLSVSDFKPKEVTERQTATFEVRLSKKTDAPLIWKVKGKLDASLSEDGLTYTLRIKEVKVSDTGDYTISIGDLTATVPLFIERTDNRIPIEFTSRVQERGKARLECEMSCKDVHVRWLKDGCDIAASRRHFFMREGKRTEVNLTDEGEYSVICTTSAYLTVDERFASLKSGMSDAQCPTGSPAELCVVLDEEKVDGVWLKDGAEMSELGGVQVVKQGAVHQLIFSAVTDAHEGKYTFRAKGAESEDALHSSPGAH
ncbi:LOW QUALITY PROTEIN: immunoglobulin superfamily member 22-like [Lycodopsis pacificus]